MSDIIMKLRAAQQAGVEVIEPWDQNPYLFGEAANEIERLRKLLRESLRVVPDGGSAAIEYVGRVRAYFESAANGQLLTGDGE